MNLIDILTNVVETYKLFGLVIARYSWDDFIPLAGVNQRVLMRKSHSTTLTRIWLR